MLDNLDDGEDGPELVITEKEKPRDKKVTFSLPPKKRPAFRKEKESEVFKAAVDTPLPQERDIVAAETLLTMGQRQKERAKKKRDKKELKRKKERR